MRPVVVVVTGAGVSAVIPPDHYQSPSTMALGVKISTGATVSYKVEHTYDDVFDPNFNPTTAVWYTHPTLGPALTANADGNYAYPPRGIRLNVASSNGIVTLTVNQAGAQ